VNFTCFTNTILTFLSIIAIGATFYGWWELGRPFSMDPLELPSAFEAPLLKGADEDNAYQITACEPHVQFSGKMVNDPGTVGRRMVLGLATDVQGPRAGEMYGC
jgi:hypothetical protein